MRKGKSVIGKPILSLADGARLHEVKDVILGAGNDTVVGLLADEGGFLASSLVVPIDEVSGFGRDAVVVARRESVVAAKEVPEIGSIVARHQSLLGTRVFTETGDDQGKINDVYFDEPTGRILGFELSGGVITDAAQGTRYIPVEELVRVGPDVAYVHPETADLLEQQRGGISGALADAGDKAKGAVGEATDGAKAATADAKPEDALLGKRTGRDVEDDNGAVVVPAGRRVTGDDIERARAADKLGGSDHRRRPGRGGAGRGQCEGCARRGGRQRGGTVGQVHPKGRRDDRRGRPARRPRADQAPPGPDRGRRRPPGHEGVPGPRGPRDPRPRRSDHPRRGPTRP